MRLVVRKVIVSLDRCRYLLEVIALFHLDIDHPTVNTCTQGNGHAQRSLHALDRLHGYRVAHTHTGTEVGISNSFRHHRL